MSATLDLRREGDALRLVARGRLDAAAAAGAWPKLARARQGAARVVVDASAVEGLDAGGAALLLAAGQGQPAEWREPLDPAARQVLARFRQGLGPPEAPKPVRESAPIAGIGAATIGLLSRGGERIRFLGEASIGTLALLRNPAALRWKELLRHLDEAGTRAFPLTILLGVLIGVILAFQGSVSLRQFGAEVFIPQLVGISLARELAPLIAGIILAGRTGSAYAAELGTMQVNEEVDALKTMGLDPVGWLVLPRIAAATLVMPVLSLVMLATGLFGMALVMKSLGYGTQTVASQLLQWMSLGDIWGGLAKSVFFGAIIGLIGCRAGLMAGRGPRAVGDAATAAVVGGIVSLVVLDGVFAVVFFRMGW
jgi:phospholipid/cholesterol/gamma-HCH transport system permease protein